MVELAYITKALVESSATHLAEQKERLELAIDSEDVSLILDTSKSLLETIFKTILTDRENNPNLGQDFGPLFKNVKNVLSFNENSQVKSSLEKLGSSIVHNVGELRNKFGAASHGGDGFFTNPVKMPEAEMIVSLVDGLAGFLYTKHRSSTNPESAARIHYEDHSEFNDWLDEQYDGYELALSEKNNLRFSASQMIFMHDMSLYREMLIQYSSTEEEDQREEDCCE